MKKLFGTDGVRGEAGKFPLDEATVRAIGSSLTRHLTARKGSAPQIVIGRDTRESGPWIEGALTGGAREAGAEIRSAGIITTPGIAFLARTLPADAGVVISASHNPYHDNGIKVFDPSGRKLDDAMERLIEADIAESGSSRTPQEINSLAPNGSAELRTRYRDYLAVEVAGDLSLDGMRIVIDCANGASYEIAPDLFARLGADVIAINSQPDGKNINRDCGSLHIEALQQRVTAERADLGVAFDGDADRALFVDGLGNFIDGDVTMWVLANYLKSRGRLDGDLVVATVMSNIGLEIGLREAGIDMVRCPVGDKYVMEEMIRRDLSLGGEQSGHVIFSEYLFTGDGLATSLNVLRTMAATGRTLSDLASELTTYPQVLVNVRVDRKLDLNTVPEVASVIATVESRLAGNGRLLIRYSGTEPLLRIMIEGKDQREIAEWAEEIAEAVRQHLAASV